MTLAGRAMRSVLIAMCSVATLPWPSTLAQDGNDDGDLRVRYGEASRLAPDAGDALFSEDKEHISSYQSENKNVGNTRIANGEDVEILNFAEVTKIEFSDARGRHSCSGVLLSVDAVLTAGHCGCGRNYEIFIQNQRVEKAKGDPFTHLEVASGPFLFPGYVCSSPAITGVGHDLALLRIMPLKLDPPDSVDIGNSRVDLKFPIIRPGVQVLSDLHLKSLFIVGFGATESGALARNLQGANVGLISRHCVQGHVFQSYCASFREFAMGRTPNAAGVPADSCGGDSGGPAYRMDSDFAFDVGGAGVQAISDRTLVGIVSRALAGVVHPYPGLCGGGGIYTTVGTRPVLEWLKSQKVAFDYQEEPIAKAKGG
jgi:hypothetical protein